MAITCSVEEAEKRQHNDARLMDHLRNDGHRNRGWRATKPFTLSLDKQQKFK